MKKLLLILLVISGSCLAQGWPPPAPPIMAQGNPLFFDNFEYVVERDDPNKAPIFYARDWTYMKDQAVAPDRHAHGYIYTTDAVLNYSGPMPSGNRVLVLETLPTTLGHYTTEFSPGAMQTDLYLQLGDPLGPTDYIPANVWFQFWVYHTAGLTGSMERQNKFLYVCRSFYPCTTDPATGEAQYEWMFLDGTTSSNPYWDELGVDGTVIPRSYFTARAPRAIFAQEPYATTHMGSNEQLLPIEALQWYLIKIHFDTSNPYGIFEMWVTPRGGQEVKVAEWIGGTTPGFMWVVINNEGHSVLRLRTTNGGKYPWQYYPVSYDVTYYIDDFTMAAHEDDLPRY